VRRESRRRMSYNTLRPLPPPQRRHRLSAGGVWSVSVSILDVALVLVAILAAVASGRYYVLAVLEQDRPLARVAAAAFFLFAIAAAVLFWRFW
jgi:hypothetical protein